MRRVTSTFTGPPSVLRLRRTSRSSYGLKTTVRLVLRGKVSSCGSPVLEGLGAVGVKSDSVDMLDSNGYKSQSNESAFRLPEQAGVVPMGRIELPTSPLPRECSTTEPHGQGAGLWTCRSTPSSEGENQAE